MRMNQLGLIKNNVELTKTGRLSPIFTTELESGKEEAKRGGKKGGKGG